jgi:hypothetical protein
MPWSRTFRGSGFGVVDGRSFSISEVCGRGRPEARHAGVTTVTKAVNWTGSAELKQASKQAKGYSVALV